jgi:tetratricopeptide (TPR) repeat protein
MVDPDRRPTAQDIEALIDLVRRDPASPAFIDLGEAYLALGRPGDALEVGNLGLQATPDNLEGRAMLARAYMALHQWKEAQGELLRVVRVDRSNGPGFALLGEVLLRRQDFERAVPVLQHAQNLDPASPHILAMLERASTGQALAPPPPLPTPVPPRGEADHGQQIMHARGPRGPRGATAKPTEPPPPVSIEGVAPRLGQAASPQNAAAAPRRPSAAAGENYLNELLTGGVPGVAGVRVPDAEFDLKPDRRWGRSTRRAFTFLFVVLVLGIGGGGTWYWWTEKQKLEAVARLQHESQLAIPAGDHAGFETCLKKLGEALEQDKSNLLTYAYFAQCSGLEALLYGTDTDRVHRALNVAREIKEGEPGAREALIGKAALELSRLGVGDGTQAAVAQVATSTLVELRTSLDAYRAKYDKDGKDKWIQWLRGRAMLAGGERRAGRATIQAAGEGDDGVLVAMIDTADLLVDDGQLDEAITVYEKAIAKAKDHPLIIVGRSLARAEASVQSDETISDLSVKLQNDLPARLSAYRHLATSLANTGIQSYPRANESLRKATAQHPPGEPRFWARIAWAHYARGDLAAASLARAKIVWFGQAKAEDDPAAQLVDAALLLASGLPEKALALAAQLQGVRPQILRAYASLDLGEPTDALKEADDILKKAPDNIEAKILREHARMVGTEGQERAGATEALEKLARQAKSKIGRHALGIAHQTNGNLKEAQTQLEQAIAEITEASPNPLVYRTRTALAEILLETGDITGAGKQLDEALKVNSGYFPARAMQAKAVLRHGEPDRALEMLEPVFDEIGAVPPALRLLYAEALGTKINATASDKDSAAAVLKDIKDQVPPADLSRAAAAIDPKLPAELGLPEPVAPGALEAAKPACDKRKRRCP